MSTKISALPAVAAALTTDTFPVVQAGVTSRETTNQLFTLLANQNPFAFQFGVTMNGDLNVNGNFIATAASGDLAMAGNLSLSGANSTISSGAGNFVVNSGGNITVPVTALTPSAGTTYIADLSKPYQAITTNAAIDLTTSSNRPAASFARSTTIRYNTSASIRALTFNASWVFLGTAPTSLPANKVAIITLTAFGSAETDIVAAYRAVD